MLNFLPQPGPRERQLKRKSENPFFAASSTIQQADIEHARVLDQEELESFLLEFRQLVEQVAALDGRADADDILKLKAQLEQFYPRACGIAGDANTFKESLSKLIAVITQALINAAAGDQEAISKIAEDQENSELHIRISEYALVSDLLSSQEIIAAEELTATLLGADQESLAAALLLFGPEQLQDILQEADTLLSSHAEIIDTNADIPMRVEQIKQWYISLGE